ncbi:hypothetical protein ACFU44_13875 [Nocardia rhizosphaerihabitans]|uniref:hypothetical protein n=1 Tax=Nocardia rhizosphaerihabitans TaxID=1691570 RepID=UPI003671EE04
MSQPNTEHKEPAKWLASTVVPYVIIILIIGILIGTMVGWFICKNATYDAQLNAIELSKLKDK